MGSAVGKKLLPSVGFAEKLCGISLHPRLSGGVPSLALTFLRPNSLLTGNLRFLGPEKSHFFSLVGAFCWDWQSTVKNKHCSIRF
jgi:hypothetical protein